MEYAGINYRDKILELVEDGLIDYETALRECLLFMSMDDNHLCYNAILGYMGVEVEEEPIIPMNGVELWREAQ